MRLDVRGLRELVLWCPVGEEVILSLPPLRTLSAHEEGASTLVFTDPFLSLPLLSWAFLRTPSAVPIQICSPQEDGNGR